MVLVLTGAIPNDRSFPAGSVKSFKRRRHYLTSGQVRERYGNRSDMWLWRKLKYDPKFPRPMVTGRLRLWDEDKLDQYDDACMKANAKLVEA
jgi:hypothetical protein